MWIERELAKILPQYFAERPVVILTGARQTGKTSLLHNSFPQLPMVSLDLPSIAEEAENLSRLKTSFRSDLSKISLSAG